ncbi:MAG TPA: dihydropteroate synthase [Desulfobulbus sp.]|nr:dihydropteroate synthase [Desulfobulbus sp.]
MSSRTAPMPRIMGILNVTPDSFSDGGRFTTGEAVEEQVRRMLAAGVDIIDVGGESTRPFAEPVGEDEELARVIPAIEVIRGCTDLPVSIDTTKAGVARAALAAGATMVNDISALRSDPDMLDVVRSHDGPVIIMHMQGTPGDMQVDPRYDDVVAEIRAFLAERIDWLAGHGVARERVIIDPGIGFGKTLDHNLAILRNIRAFKDLGCPVLIGHSRKSFFAKLLGLPVEERDCATAQVSVHCAGQGADILRVHDVGATRNALRLQAALRA